MKICNRIIWIFIGTRRTRLLIVAIPRSRCRIRSYRSVRCFSAGSSCRSRNACTALGIQTTRPGNLTGRNHYNCATSATSTTGTGHPCRSLATRRSNSLIIRMRVRSTRTFGAIGTGSADSVRSRATACAALHTNESRTTLLVSIDRVTKIVKIGNRHTSRTSNRPRTRECVPRHIAVRFPRTTQAIDNILSDANSSF